MEEEQVYVYQMRPLVIPGLMFIIIYPLVTGVVYLLSKFSGYELQALAAIYFLAVLSILALWVFANKKRVEIKDDQIIFYTLFGRRSLQPPDIRRVISYWNSQGQEIAQIRTKNHAYYLSELYFPFPELMAELEKFVMDHAIRSNFSGYGLTE